MQRRTKLILLRLVPPIFITLAAAAWFNEVQGGGPYVMRNLLPPLIMLLLAYVCLRRGDGSWSAAGWQWPLAILGYSIPALGLSVYLHYAYRTNLDGLFTGAEHATQLFRFLPAYTIVAGGIGFAIGWIVGRRI